MHARHDGWTPERQVGFIEALAETACVTQAAAAVGLSATAAYNLRRRPEAQAFQLAWDAALDFRVRRLADAALSRAVHGVPRPIYYQGERIGEWRHYDERLTMFILRLRDPVRFGDWRNAREAVQHFDGPALVLSRMANLASDAAYDGADNGTPAPPDPHMLAAALGGPAPRRKRAARRSRDDAADLANYDDAHDADEAPAAPPLYDEKGRYIPPDSLPPGFDWQADFPGSIE
ncbi:MAG: hypothetical protein CVT78_13915 [Alphaproteobacteria bacterium HGW-Alphaproteobacteria-17]|nr:MAG: hypothetical protein CVT78_13915 [Alphaproteobacteria bacterium HGW-Alphaproteobacteria-17]